ncbi:MAG: T9SS type A sorting domain-containing protein [Bacteroidetes bacterium]|jgi:photosystem II stability/assembly factor-like uncharacterized protein|nr:T9SS type A sorting domain-containing protein [Bacteroidota bacterium]
MHISKKISLALFAVLICFTLLAQESAEKPTYKEMMEDNSYNFYEVVKAAETYFDANGRGKGSGFKPYERWKSENESKYAPSGDRYNVDHYFAAKQYRALLADNSLKTKTSFANGWEELGPWDANNVTSHYSPGIGRVEDFWVDPANDQTIYLASRSGGFWKTTDGGANWTNTTDYLVASGVRTIAVNPSNKNEILINVQQGGNGYTQGVYRSTNAGATWTASAFIPDNLNWGGLGDNERIYKIKYHPTVANKIFLGTTKGLYVSTDNLATWTQLFTGATTDITFHPTNDQIVYAFRNNGTDRNVLKKSTDGGATFSNAGTFANNGERQIFLSVSPDEPSHVYAASTNGVYKSTNEGNIFAFLTNPEEAGLAFAVSDLDVNAMIYGYVDLHNSTDNGATFTKQTSWSTQDESYVHADLRIAGCVNGVFYVGTDGYLAKSEDNGVTWTRLNDGTGIREFYAVGSSQGDYDVHMAGSQDNGTSIHNKDGWVEWNGGDGMEALVHPLNSNWMVGSWQFGTRNYTHNGGFDGRRGTGNPEGGSDNAAWESPLLLNPLNQMQMIHMGRSLYKGDKFGREWNLMSSPGIGIITEAAIAETDSNVIAISRGSVLQLTTDGGEIWNQITLGLPGYTFTDIAFDPKDENTILVTYNRYQQDNRKIFISYDQGTTWENITYNLGDMPLRTVEMDHSDSSYIYVGGEIGVYYKSKKGTTWTLYADNLPNVTVKDLEIQYGSNTLRAATWGRGLWENTLIGRNEYPSINYVNITSTPTDFSPKAETDQYVTANIPYGGTLKNVTVLWSEGNTSLTNSISMSLVDGDEWRSDDPIGAQALGDNVYFKVVAEGSNSDISETYTFHYNLKESVYCDASGSLGTGSDYINYVKLNDVENTSGQEYYGDFTSTEIVLARTKTYDLEVRLNYHFEGQDSVLAWIDFNSDKDFTQDEGIVMSKLDASHYAVGTFTVPVDANMEKLARMRVRSIYWQDNIDPCGETAGEVEDYTIRIEENPNVSVTEIATITSRISPIPSYGTFTVTLASVAKQALVSVIDINGKEVYSQSFQSAAEMTLQTELAPGTYLVKVSTEKGASTQKLVVK